MQHRLTRDHPVQHVWDAAAPPVLEVDAGDELQLDLVMAGHGQFSPGMDLAEATIDWDTLYHLAGPISVRGAKPGMSLRVEILELTPGTWRSTSQHDGLGLRPEEVPGTYRRTFELTGEPWVEIAGGIRAPVHPFLGTMG